MTEKTRLFIIIGSTLLLCSIVFSLLFEIKKVPDVSWAQDYKYDSKDPHGAWLFKEALSKIYGNENVEEYKNIDSLPPAENQLYINYGPNIIVTQKKQKELEHFLERYNNNVLFIANDIETYNDTFNNFYVTSYYDSLTSISFNEADTVTFSFPYFKTKIKDPIKTFHSAVEDFDFIDSTFQTIGSNEDSLSIFFKKEHNRGNIYYYLNPYNFSNIAAKQEDYLAHLNKVFSHFEADKIILDSPKKSDILQNKYSDNSPIQYILSQASLAWAYYLTLISLLIFVLFRGKRKQRIIPITKENKNTSLEYIDTVSQLFLSQKQNSKLVEHIENNFYHKVKKKYFIDKDNNDFINLFSHKSKIDKTEVNQIIDIFKSAKDGYEFNDDQLHRLHKNLENIYTNWK